MAKSKSKPAPKSKSVSKSKPVAKKKPVAPKKPVAKKATKPASRSSPKSKWKPVLKSVPKVAAKPKTATGSKAPAKSVKTNRHPPAGKPAKAIAKPEPSRASSKAPVKSTVSEKSSKVSSSSAKPVTGKSPVASEGKKPNGAGAAREKLRSRILAQKTKPAKPVAFSLDEVKEFAKTISKNQAAESIAAPVKAKAAAKHTILQSNSLRAAKPAHIKAASLADILGFNPKQKASHAESEEALIPDKYKRYYKLLIELRNHVTGQVDQHSEETLKRSAKEDSGDLSSYGTDGGTDSFDRDFALSLVANEQEALAEIEAAIQRIKAGNYGICEHTLKPISKERLVAVPFTRYTAESLKVIEKTRYKVRGQTGILGEGEEGAKVEDDSGGDE